MKHVSDSAFSFRGEVQKLIFDQKVDKILSNSDELTLREKMNIYFESQKGIEIDSLTPVDKMVKPFIRNREFSHSKIENANPDTKTAHADRVNDALPGLLNCDHSNFDFVAWANAAGFGLLFLASFFTIFNLIRINGFVKKQNGDSQNSQNGGSNKSPSKNSDHNFKSTNHQQNLKPTFPEDDARRLHKLFPSRIIWITANELSGVQDRDFLIIFLPQNEYGPFFIFRLINGSFERVAGKVLKRLADYFFSLSAASRHKLCKNLRDEGKELTAHLEQMRRKAHGSEKGSIKSLKTIGTNRITANDQSSVVSAQIPVEDTEEIENIQQTNDNKGKARVSEEPDEKMLEKRRDLLEAPNQHLYDPTQAEPSNLELLPRRATSYAPVAIHQYQSFPPARFVQRDLQMEQLLGFVKKDCSFGVLCWLFKSCYTLSG